MSVKKTPNDVQLSVRLDSGLHGEFREFLARNDLAQSQGVRMALRLLLSREDERRAAIVVAPRRAAQP